jgi:uncharacterized membrane protein
MRAPVPSRSATTRSPEARTRPASSRTPPAFADYAELACSLIRRYGAAEPTISAALLIMLRDAQALVNAPDRIQVLASHARLVLSDAEQLTQQPAVLQVRDQAALLLADGT